MVYKSSYLYGFLGPPWVLITVPSCKMVVCRASPEEKSDRPYKTKTKHTKSNKKRSNFWVHILQFEWCTVFYSKQL